MKTLKFTAVEPTNEDAVEITITGRTWLSCLGKIDEELDLRSGPGVTLVDIWEDDDIQYVCHQLDIGLPYARCSMSDPESNFVLRPIK